MGAAGNTAATNTTAKRSLLDKLLGGGSGASAISGAGTKTAKGAVENGVAAGAGTGATSGLPTVGDDGTINMVYHQVRSIPPGRSHRHNTTFYPFIHPSLTNENR